MPSSTRRFSARPASPRGFTMIELLTVIAIIGIISGIVVLGLGSVGTARKRDQTVTLLSSLNSALAEITNSPGGAQKLFTIQLPNIYFPETSNNFRDSNYKSWIGVPAGSLEAQARTARVLNEILGTNRNAKALLDGISADRRGKFATTIGATTFSNTIPVPLDAWGNPVVFVFDNLQIATGTNVSRPFTVDVGPPPEIEVGGLTNIYSDADKSYYEPVNVMTPTPTYSGTGGSTTIPQPASTYRRINASDPEAAKFTAYTARRPVVSNPSNPLATEQTLRSPDHRPFWMSAGPDGKYETTDDNVYSFGN